jgi:hypothetical protein|uniref:S-adenosyl-L-methionine:salicylic acid carboxyl methyltransferase n=1 Tax=Chimonanthus praecox TaxID=13419 RepID=A7XZE9_9MAGN|nr:S-adenosyl-L-methionine:salicylic acid carboxyl methyltransferase [Chimonanthus praecox]
MEVLSVLHMNGGIEESSYANNSAIQRKAISKAEPIAEEAIHELFSSSNSYNNKFRESLGIADLGCSSGPNTLLMISKIIDIINGECRHLGLKSPELQIFLNDLPGNDFNTIFTSLPDYYQRVREKKGDDFGPYFIVGVPGSFYGRLFPSRSLHFVHSSYSLMWLSQVPPALDGKRGSALNKGNIYMAKTSPPVVLKAYLDQFQKDFFTFLSCRSEEMVAGGRMVLTFLGRKSSDPTSKECCFIWELLANALNDMVSQGLIEEEKVDSFNLPQYTPSPEEVKSLVVSEGSFLIHRLETYTVSWDPQDKLHHQSLAFNALKSGAKVAMYMRAVAESLLTSHFGGAIIDDLFQKYKDTVSEKLEREEPTFTNLVISLEKKADI